MAFVRVYCFVVFFSYSCFSNQKRFIIYIHCSVQSKSPHRRGCGISMLLATNKVKQNEKCVQAVLYYYYYARPFLWDPIWIQTRGMVIQNHPNHATPLIVAPGKTLLLTHTVSDPLLLLSADSGLTGEGFKYLYIFTKYIIRYNNMWCSLKREMTRVQ